MTDRMFHRQWRLVAGSLVLFAVATGVTMAAQPSSPTPPQTAESAAPIDLTGYWVAIVTQDWLYRMVVPAKGEYTGVPLNLAAKQFADAWSAAPDIASGQQCKAYGAGSIMRIPGRIHIKWADPQTLRIDTDAGMQTRLLRFNASETDADAPASLQGFSTAQWEYSAGPAGGAADAAIRGPGAEPTEAQLKAHQGWLRARTTHVLPGYLRKNGIPYGSQMQMLEYWQKYKGPDGRDWLFIASEIDDAQYLQSPYDITPIFREEPNGEKFSPTPCTLNE